MSGQQMSVFSYVSKYILCGGAGSWTMSQRPAVMLLAVSLPPPVQAAHWRRCQDTEVWCWDAVFTRRARPDKTFLPL